MLAAALVALAGAAPTKGPARITLVFCAPGAPGTTAEAQGAMDAFAAALAGKAGLPPNALAAVYEPAEAGGVARLRGGDARIALVSLPFLLAHEKALGLRPRLQAVLQGGAAPAGAATPGGAAKPNPAAGAGPVGGGKWALVARKGRVSSAAALDGYTLSVPVGLPPAFVRGPVLAGWGRLPAGARITPTPAVLSALRRAAAGEKVAVLLDAAQEAALPSLPFAAELEVVARSPALPAGVVAVVGERVPEADWSRLEAAFRSLPSDPAGQAALEGIRMQRFAPLDEEALSRARAAWAEAAR